MDSLRGLGGVVVVLAHSYAGTATFTVLHPGQWDWLFFESLRPAVQLFAGLSAFLLARPFLLAHQRGTAAPRAGAFYRRRVLRIVPAYWVALTVLALTVPAAAPDVFTARWPIYYGFAQGYVDPSNATGLGVAWSLTAEVSFYLLLPLLATLMRGVGAWRLVAGMTGLGLAVQILVASGAAPWADHLLLGLPGQSPYFAVGLALAIWSVRGAPPRLLAVADRPGATWLAAAAVYLVMAAAFTDHPPIHLFTGPVREVGFGAATAVLIGLLLIPTVFERPGVVQRWLSARALVFIGTIAFGMYLWHTGLEAHLARHGFRVWLADWPLLAQLSVSFAVMLAGSIATGWVSYRVIELPFLRLKRTRPQPRVGTSISKSTGVVAGGVRRS